MPEILTLTTPVVPATLVSYRVRMIHMDLDDATIVVRLKGSNGEIKTCGYNRAAATTRIIVLNKANLTIKSLERRVIEEFQADGQLPAGTISGTPD